MAAATMHEDQVEVDLALVRRLLAAQFPCWAGLPLTRVPSNGTVNAIFRLGDDMTVRLPLAPWGVAHIEREDRWLPRLAPHLPLAVPEPLARGEPGDGYPFSWSVHRWLAGQDAATTPPADLDQAAADLARFITALQRLDFGGKAPRGRGLRLEERDRPARRALEQLEGVIDTAVATAVWEADLAAPAWEGAPVWIHGDLLPTNLLVRDGRLSAVIDFGEVGVGDPACDLIPAWSLFTAASRDLFRRALQVDDATWRRGRGWAFSQALLIVPYYWNTNRHLVDVALRVIGEVLDARQLVS